MSKTLPTAEEIRLKYIPNGCANLKLLRGGDGKLQFKHEKQVIDEMLIEFAKLHVEAALKAASEVELIDSVDFQSGDVSYYQNDTGILNAYPLTNIK